jgi:hypothetical protein
VLSYREPYNRHTIDMYKNTSVRMIFGLTANTVGVYIICGRKPVSQCLRCMIG